jgi:NAD(P)-dependent dehydrogenase (short-subunit alcohol dehydrogenase family)
VLYAASKAAVRTFARNFSSEFAARGIRVNVVSPGPVETPIWGGGGSDPSIVEEVLKQVKAGVPLGRLGQPEEVAQAILFRLRRIQLHARLGNHRRWRRDRDAHHLDRAALN